MLNADTDYITAPGRRHTRIKTFKFQALPFTPKSPKTLNKLIYEMDTHYVTIGFII